MPSEKSRDKSVSKSSSDRKYKSDFKLTEEKEEYSSSKQKDSSSKSKSSSKHSSDILDLEKKGSSASSSGSKQKNKYDEKDDQKDSKSKSNSYKTDDYERESKKKEKDKEKEREKDRDRREREKDKEKPRYVESDHKSSRHKSEKEEKYEKSSSKSKSKKHHSDNNDDNDDDDLKYKLNNKNDKRETNYNDAYEDDFENDFESDTSEKETSMNKSSSAKNRESSANYNIKSSKDEFSSKKKVYSSDEDHNNKKSSKSKEKNNYDDYDDHEYNNNRSKSKTLKANAHIKIPTDLIEVYSSKIYFNHDSVDRQKRRAKDLMKTIELDKKNFNLLDLNPIEMRTVYSSHLKHQKVQTNDDTTEIEIQTDEIDESNKWTQYPPDDSKGSGSDDKKLNNYDNETDSNILEKFRFELNLTDLQNFLQRSSKVVEKILNEKKLNEMNKDLDVNKTDIEFSKGFLKFIIPKSFGSELTKSAQITNCSFCKDDPSFFVTSYNYSKKESILFNSSILCVWNVNEPNSPYRILVCESVSTSLCYFSFIVVSGNIDGSVSIWDLRESSHLHHFNCKNKKFTSEFQSNSIPIRSSTYTTAGILQNENHLSEIKSIITLQNSMKDNRKDVFMQLATLEIDCRLIIWTVVELKNVDLAIFETDLGLLPGGKLKLVKNSQIILNDLIRTPFGKIPYQTMCMSASTSDVNDFYIATNVGQIIHINRKGSSYSSSLLKSDLQNGLVIVNCVAFHHELHEIFLAGYGNGEIRLYHKNYMTPIKIWLMSCNGNRIKQIEWLQCRNSAFMVIDESDNLYMWDLLQDDTQSIFSKEIVNLGGLSFCEFKQKDLENNRPPFGLYNRGSKEIEIHFFTPEWSNKNGGDKERKKFNKLIKNYLLIF